jgi:hypothetical protein
MLPSLGGTAAAVFRLVEEEVLFRKAVLSLLSPSARVLPPVSIYKTALTD